MLRLSALVILLTLLLPAGAWAQKNRTRKQPVATQRADTLRSIQLRGRVLGAELQDTLPGVHVHLIDANGKTLKLTQTGDDGQYVLTDVPVGRFVMRFTCMGFLDENMRVSISGKSAHLLLGDVLLRENSTLMREAVVQGQMAEMTVSDDTLVYNADAFKVQEGAMVEELPARHAGTGGWKGVLREEHAGNPGEPACRHDRQDKVL